MTRRGKPTVAIGEAMRAATKKGYRVLPLTGDDLPFDFIAWSPRSAALVRVRRLRWAEYDPREILRSCAAEVAELRELPAARELEPQLWARGPHKGWHRYRVSPGAIEEVVGDDHRPQPDQATLASFPKVPSGGT